METIQIEVTIDLATRLEPYKNDLSKLLELGLRCLEENQTHEPNAILSPQHVIDVLRRAGAIGPDLPIIANYLAQPETQAWQPIPTGGKPASEIIIDQRHGMNGDEDELF